VAVLALLFKANLPNIILFGSVGASAAILTNSDSEHLIKLRTALIGYSLAILFSSIIFLFNRVLDLPLALNILLVIFPVTLAQFLLNSFHPPAVGASLSFILLDKDINQLASLFITILVLLIIVRMITYVFSNNLSVEKFWDEFKKYL